jgi:hypothetical protein
VADATAAPAAAAAATTTTTVAAMAAGARLSLSAMDARRLQLRPCSVEIVLDKGTLDALLTEMEDGAAAGDAASVPPAAVRVVREVWRALVPGGVYVLVSHSGAAERVPLVCGCGVPWEVLEAGALRKNVREFGVIAFRRPLF